MCVFPLFVPRIACQTKENALPNVAWTNDVIAQRTDLETIRKNAREPGIPEATSGNKT